MKNIIIHDVETFPNHWMICLLKLSGGHKYFYKEDVDQLKKIFFNSNIYFAGFNSANYDCQMLNFLFKHPNATHADLYEYSKLLVETNEADTDYFPLPNQIDLIGTMPFAIKIGSKGGSLKAHQFRMRYHNLQDFHISFDSELTESEKDEADDYCLNDCQSTADLFKEEESLGAFKVRSEVLKNYTFLQFSETFSLSDSALSTRILKKLYNNRAKKKVTKTMVPQTHQINLSDLIIKDVTFISKFNKKALEDLKNIPVIDIKNNGYSWLYGASDFNKEFISQVKFDIYGNLLKMGVGGLHYQPTQVFASGNLINMDFTSYYPFLILNSGLVPVHMEPVFIEIFREMVNERLAYKAAGNKTGADSLKIFINSLFGKLFDLGYFTDPALYLYTVLNGQLIMLSIMEQLENAGVDIITANTDGILVDAEGCEDTIDAIRKDFEQIYGLEMGFDKHDTFIASSCNDYILDDKRKGLFSVNLKLPEVVKTAVYEHFINKTPTNIWIEQQKSVYEFMFFSSVGNKTESLSQNGKKLQKKLRFYKSTEVNTPIIKKMYSGESGKLSNSDNARVMNKVVNESVPLDMDFSYYINKANIMIAAIENKVKPSAKLVDMNEFIAKISTRIGLNIVPIGKIGKLGAQIDRDLPENPENLEEYVKDINYNEFTGAGLIIGKPHGTIAIIITDLEKSRASGLFKFTKSANFAVWQYDKSLSQLKAVRTGEIEGVLVFAYAHPNIQQSDDEFHENNGFIIQVDTSITQIRGMSDGDLVCNSSTAKPKTLPIKLEQLLLELNS